MAAIQDPVPDAALPLAGITVVELCHSVAGPYGGMVLAGLGAEVIKVENPDRGDHARGWGPPYWHGKSTTFQSLNRDKLGVTVDLSDPGQLGRFKQLVLDRADVFIQNLRPGSIDQYGLGGEQLLREKPSLVYCNLGAFGRCGPLHEMPGYDPLMQAFGGLMSVTGEQGRAPVRVGPAVVDMGSGMWSVIGILAALLRRGVTGRGAVVDTSLFETAVAWMTIITAGYLASGEVRRPMGSGIAEIVPHQAFPTRDGYIMVAAGNDSLFRKLSAAIDRAAWADDLRFASNDGRVRHRVELIGAMEQIFAKQPSAEWARRLDSAGVPNAPIQSVDEVVAHPQTKALGIVQEAPDVDMQLVGLPLSFDGKRPAFRRVAPDLGQHNRELGVGSQMPPAIRTGTD
jgi:crotonobetainyl-CoA:carnitine CoA-transferase CaiB-like acyl-CoA transferase